MGTFHDDKGELHGITVVVDIKDGRVAVGRCDERTPQGIILLDADLHSDGDDGRSTDEFLERAVKFGVWPKHARLTVPDDDIADVRRLGDVARD